MTSVRCSILWAAGDHGPSNKDIFEEVHPAICNPPYNTSQIEQLLNCEHNWLNLQDMDLCGAAQCS